MIIAEIGTSHLGSIQKAKELVDEAYSAGADTIKFQWVYADEILHPDTGFVNLPGGKIRLYDRFKDLEVPPSFYKEMLDYTHSKSLKFCCSPFGLRSLQELLDINPDYVKIASPELNHFPLLKSLAEYRKQNPIPVIVSSGVSKLKDIEKALDILGPKNVSLLHCITSYPAPEDEYNVKLVQTLSDIFGISSGISDHSLDPILVPCLSVALGGTIIEKHITLSKTTDGLDDPVALTGIQFTQMVQAVHKCETVLNHYGKERGKDEIIKQLEYQFSKEKIQSVIGSGIKKLADSEKANYGRTNRSLHFMRTMKSGDVIKENDIGVLRTEKVLTPGIDPDYYDFVIGKTLTHDITNGSGIQLEDLVK